MSRQTRSVPGLLKDRRRITSATRLSQRATNASVSWFPFTAIAFLEELLGIRGISPILIEPMDYRFIS